MLDWLRTIVALVALVVVLLFARDVWTAAKAVQSYQSTTMGVS